MILRVVTICTFLLLTIFPFYSQTVILDDPGPYSYPSNDMVNTDNFMADISNCTSISLSFDFLFNLPWEGNGNMESQDECPLGLGTCNGDPDGQNGTCDNCWDFLDWQVTVDGFEIGYDLIGDAGTTDAEQMGTISFGPVCTMGDDINLRIRNQSWSSDEQIDFSNIMILCWEAIPDIDPLEACSGEDIDLDGTATDVSIISDWSWTNSGPGTIANPSSQNTTASDASDGETYILTVTDENGCTGSTDEVVMQIPGPTADVITIMGCSAELIDYDLTQESSNVNSSEPVTWYDGQPSMGGILLGSPTNVDLTALSSLWALVTDSGTGCTIEIEINIVDTGGPTGELSGEDDLCPGECVPIFLNLSGGTPEYLIDISFFGFPPVSIPGIGVNDAINVCYEPSGSFDFQQSSLTFTLPEIPFVSSIEMTLNAILDDAGCLGIVNGGPVSITFLEPISINMVGPYEECDDGSGMASFDLTAYESDLGGGTIVFYSDPDGNNPISSPYTTSSTTIYAQILGFPCDSEIVPIELNVVLNGDAGTVIYCDSPGTSSCEYCDTGAVGEEIDIFVEFTNPNVTGFDITLTLGTTETISITEISPDNRYTITMTESAFVTVSIIYIDGQCPDNFSPVAMAISIYRQPEFTEPSDITACDSAVLPIVTANVGDDPQYFTMPGGMGTVISPGTSVTTSGTYYLYSGVPDCDLDYPFDVTILQDGMLDPVQPVVSCGSYTLPQISGTNLYTAGYFSGPAGTGTPFDQGDVITSSMTMYIFAQCGDLEVSFDITISAGPTFDISDTTVCDYYIVPSIESTPPTANAAYFDQANGMGVMISIGDTIFQDSTIYLFDNSPGCTQDIPIDILINQLDTLPDTTFLLCPGSILDIYIDSLFGLGMDTMGYVINTISSDSIGEVEVFKFDQNTTPIDQIYEFIIYDTLCGQDTAMISFLYSSDTPNNGVRFNPIVCDSSCVQMEVYGAGVDSFFVSISDGLTSLPFIVSPSLDDTTGVFEVCNYENGIFDGNDLEANTIYTFSIDSMSSNSTDCQYGPGISVIFRTFGDIETDYRDTLCQDMDVNIGGEIFNAANPSGPVMFTTGDGCDSTVNVMLLFEQSNYNTINELVCGDTLLDLSLLIAGFDGSGTFSENIVSGGLSGMNFNTAGLSIDDYPVLYTTGSMCQDTTEIIIGLSGGPSAGDPVIEETCNTEISLFDFLAANADLGGEFYLGGTLIPNGEYTIDIQNPPGVFTYVIGGGDCPIDMTTIEVNFADFPILGFVIPLNFCADSCRNITINISDVPADTIYASITDGIDSYPIVIPTPNGNMGVLELCNLNDGIFNGTNLEPNNTYFIETDSVYSAVAGCTFDGGVITQPINTSIYESDFIETFCSDTTIMIDGIAYTDDFTGTVAIEGGGQFGCDSTINVDITFEDINYGTQVYSACAGTAFIDPDFGESWTVADNQRDVIISNGSSNGCDSIVAVTVTFSNEVVEPYPISLCGGETETVLGIVFDINSTTDTLNTGETTATGCDSLIAVMIIPEGNMPTPLTGNVCKTYEEQVASGVFFNMNNMGDTVSVGSATNGCDSLVINNYDYILLADTTYIDTTVCDDSFFIQIGQFVYNQDEPSGLIDFPGTSSNGCDSIISISITYNTLDIDYEVFPSTCSTQGLVQVNSPILNGDTLELPEFPIIFMTEMDSDSALVELSLGECEYFRMIYIPNNEETTFNIDVTDGQVTVDTLGTEFQSIIWTPSSGLNCTDCIDPLATPDSTTTYTGTITYGDGCTAEVEFTIDIQLPPPPFVDYFVPNIININGASGNRILRVIPSRLAEGLVTSMGIYDRWGNLIYFSSDATYLTNGGGWDGTMDGNELSQGVYIYTIIIVEPTGDIIRRVGDVTLLR